MTLTVTASEGMSGGLKISFFSFLASWWPSVESSHSSLRKQATGQSKSNINIITHLLQEPLFPFHLTGHQSARPFNHYRVLLQPGMIHDFFSRYSLWWFDLRTLLNEVLCLNWDTVKKLRIECVCGEAVRIRSLSSYYWILLSSLKVGCRGLLYLFHYTSLLRLRPKSVILTTWFLSSLEHRRILSGLIFLWP